MAVDLMKGKFITLEGTEGSGKSTQAALILEYLKEKKQPVMLMREPGGVQISEAIRRILLDVESAGMADSCETLLYMAARAQLVKEVLEPALASGKIILCDRFLDSTIAYQGYGNGVDVATIEAIGAFATNQIAPDLTLLFDVATEIGLSRTQPEKDRIELRSLEYHQRVRAGYLALAKKYPQRIKVIEVNAPKEIIFKQVKTHIDACLG